MEHNRTINVYDRVAGESVNVPGQPEGAMPTAPEWADMGEDERRHRFGGQEPPGAELPVLVERDMRTGPVEGEQGSYSKIVALDDPCEVCGYDRGLLSVHTLAGVHRIKCRACETVVEQG